MLNKLLFTTLCLAFLLLGCYYNPRTEQQRPGSTIPLKNHKNMVDAKKSTSKLFLKK